MHPDKAEAAESAVNKVTLFLDKLNAFCERFDEKDTASFKLTGSGWTENYSYGSHHKHWFHSNLKQLEMLQVFYSLTDAAEDIVLLPDDVALANIKVPTERLYARPDVSSLAFDPFILNFHHALILRVKGAFFNLSIAMTWIY